VTVMLYRAADEPNPQVWDWNVEHQVFDEADVSEALGAGWKRHPTEATQTPEEPAGEAPKRRGRPPKEG
jgi:hypothetical protein